MTNCRFGILFSIFGFSAAWADGQITIPDPTPNDGTIAVTIEVDMPAASYLWSTEKKNNFIAAVVVETMTNAYPPDTTTDTAFVINLEIDMPGLPDFAAPTRITGDRSQGEKWAEILPGLTLQAISSWLQLGESTSYANCGNNCRVLSIDVHDMDLTNVTITIYYQVTATVDGGDVVMSASVTGFSMTANGMPYNGPGFGGPLGGQDEEFGAGV